MTMELSYLQAAITGFVQGITELFPISSLGHAVLVPAWVGGSWKNFTTDPQSPYLTITIALHLASAIALFLFFRKRWFTLIGGGLNSLRGKRSETGGVFWMIVVATIPVATLGFLFEHKLRDLFAKPIASALFLTINGVILIFAERKSRRGLSANENEIHEYSEKIGFKSAIAIGFAQSLALFAGISRFGVSMSAGLARGLSHSSASDFAFLLALPVILGASIAKVPDLFTSTNSHLAGPILLGCAISGVATYASVAFLVKWFKTKTLYPFAIYCLVLGVASLIRFA